MGIVRTGMTENLNALKPYLVGYLPTVPMPIKALSSTDFPSLLSRITRFAQHVRLSIPFFTSKIASLVELQPNELVLCDFEGLYPVC
jgi:hypothetical protein